MITRHYHSVISFLSTVFATYRAEVRIIDPVKKAALSRILLDGIVSTKPGEKLDEKLANLILPSETGERVSFN
jgi:hypothetical protein